MSPPTEAVKTGDIVKIIQLKDKYADGYCARVTAIKNSNNDISITINRKQTWFAAKLAHIMQRGDAYACHSFS